MIARSRLKPLVISLILYFIGFFITKSAADNIAITITGSVFMLAGLIMNVVFVAKIFKDQFTNKD